MNSNRAIPALVSIAVCTAVIFLAVSKFRPARTVDLDPSLHSQKTGDSFFDAASSGASTDPQATRRFLAIEAEQNRLDESIWAREMEAERHEDVFTKLWDSLRYSQDEFAVLESFDMGGLMVGKPNTSEILAYGIKSMRVGLAEERLNRDEWKVWLKELKRQGFRLEQSEWRHTQFDPANNGTPARSVIAATLHIANPRQNRRIIFKGDLRVEWQDGTDPRAAPVPRMIETANVELLERVGYPAFEEALVKQITPQTNKSFIDPLILFDLDGDGFSEIILACKNLVYWNRGGGRFEPAPLCDHFPELVSTGIIADFTGEGVPDFLCADRGGLLLYAGDAQGRFRGAARRVWQAGVQLPNPFVITAGDIDQDGHLDVWLAQYKLPYNAGQMPTPYYDANDGFPSFLLINDGRGNFRDATESAGLAKKRFRRTYSASFVDLDGDGDLDLVIVSDFAGVDVYYNDGHGHFTDVTTHIIDEPHAFGMAHCFGDFDGDGRMDFLMIGMNSFTARRLDLLALGSPEFLEHQKMRPLMGYGNRLYFSRGQGFRQESLSGQVARTGWSWGVAAFDFDNDGDLDLYIANGHKSRRSAKDYETQFWRHDIYAATSQHDPALDIYFQATGSRLYGQGESYGGYEKNRLLMNHSGKSFTEVGYLMGVSMELDCRNVVSDDLDGDGKLDLLVTTFMEWPERMQTLRLFKNRFLESGNWIGFQLREAGSGFSPVGAKIMLNSSAGKQSRYFVTGDSHRAQHANTAHFGLGRQTNVDSVEVHWPNGRTQTIRNPALNRYHSVQPQHE
ncbi:MAG: CRTAC1 family protein [Pedosphaera sp.]|nr:CRTAC1 family protein [Pedosphaera sp.]